MKHLMRKSALFAVVSMFAVAGCADLDVVNPNAPDTERALSSPGDVESLVAGSWGNWWLTSHNLDGPVGNLANASFQLSSWPANFGMVFYSYIPRNAVENSPTHEFYGQQLNYVWSRNYRALSAVAQGLQAIEDPAIAEALGPERVLRIRAFGRFVQGLAHGSLGLFYQEAFIVDETTDLLGEMTAVDYNAMLDASLGYFDEAIALGNQGGFENIPSSWMTVNTSPAQLARIASSMKARYRANMARTPAERDAVNWAAVMSEIENGVPDGWNLELQFFSAPFWSDHVGQFSSAVGWAQVSYMIEGMADQSGNYQRWLEDPAFDRFPDFPDGSPVLIITPDERFPQGSTLSEQVANPGTMRRAGFSSRGQPGRGTHRWSHYFNTTMDFHRAGGTTVPEITATEMRLLRAEGLIRQGGAGNLAEAASLINVTRVAAGLSPTNADGANDSCVPKLPSGQCGDLLEMMKWEKRMHTGFFGVHGNTWYFDGRGWGDLFEGTYLAMPMPCLDAELLFLPCNSTGGIGGEASSPGSIYGIE